MTVGQNQNLVLTYGHRAIEVLNGYLFGDGKTTY